MKNLIIIGAGGFGKEMFEYINHDIKNGFLKDIKIKGFLDSSEESFKRANIPTNFLGSEDDYEIQNNDTFLVAIGSVSVSSKVYEKLEKRGANFFTYIHSTAIVANSAKIGKGVIICPYCIVNAQATIKDYSDLNIFSSVGHDSKLGKGCILSPYVTLNGNVIIGDNVFIGTKSAVLLGSSIGNKCIISANTTVKGVIKDNFMIKDKISQIQVKNRLI